VGVASSRLRAVLERRLEQEFPISDRSELNRAVRHSLFPGGKRIRPVLCLTTFLACGGKSLGQVLPSACALELIHTFSLIQDDLPSMDDDKLRRGKPALHVAFGEAKALLASDALFSRAFACLSAARVPDRRRLAAIDELALTTQALVCGQWLDIAPDKRLSARTLQRMHELKTGRLIAASLRLGAIAAGAGSAVVRGLGKAGEHLGMLFQITDDMLDREQEAGKARRLTYPAFFGVRKTRATAVEHHGRYLRQLGRQARRLTAAGMNELAALGDAVLKRQA
jgi:geranylgeranyl diphosphate synthase type II